MNTPAPGPLLTEADLTTDASGQSASLRYGDIYASRAGALGQARAVYLQGCGLLDSPAGWAGQAQFTVLETGFGLGVNFLATWAAWRADPRRCDRLHYVSVELHPVRAADLLAHAPPELHALAAELAALWPAPVRGLHPIVLDSGRVHLLLAFGDAANLVPRLRLAADALYLDGFTPSRNPDMWTPTLFRALARLTKPGARAASYTVAHAVQKGLDQAGFNVELLAGWGGKQQRLQARFNPIWKRTRHTLPQPWPLGQRRHAVVVGAGITGAACAHALAQRGWTVEVLESGQHPAGGGSAMPAGLAHLQPSADDNLLSRLSRAGMAALRRALPADSAGIARFSTALLTPADAAEAQRMQDWRSSVHLPPQMAQWADAGAARQALGVAQADAGWLVDSAVLANKSLCAAWLDSPRITLRCQMHATQLQHDGAEWTVLDPAGQVIARAPQVVLACALQTPQLLASSALIPSPQWLPLHALRGQAQVLPAPLWPALRALRQPWMGSGYVLSLPEAAVRQLHPAADPMDTDWLLIGATFESADSPLAPEQAWVHNRAGLAALTTDPPAPGHMTALRHLVGTRAASADRLPYCGTMADLRPLLAEPQRWAGKHLHELPRMPGLAVCAGMGSRGLTLAALLADYLAARIEGTPLPIETDLADGLDPARIALRRLRQGDIG